MSDYSVYIDEAGDLGVNRGTDWFVISAVVVAKSDEPKIRAKMAQIKRDINVHEIHLRKIGDFFKRAYIVRELNGENFVYMNVLVDTRKFDIAKIPNSATAYNYVCKYLLQRVSWYLESVNGKADIVLSSRGTSRDGELIDYIEQKLLPFPANSIKSECFEKVCAKSSGEWDLLQLADVCATTMFLTYQVNWLGFSVPCFSRALLGHLYTKNGKYYSYGLKFFTSEMSPDAAELKKRIYAKTKKELPVRLPRDWHAG